MLDQNNKGRNAAARPLLAYAPEFLQTPPSRTTAELADELLAEREHRRRREELLRRKQQLLEDEAALPAQPLDPQADMRQRMHAVREELQARLAPGEPEAQAPAVTPRFGTATEPPAIAVPDSKPRRRLRWGRVFSLTVLGGLAGAGYALLVPPQYGASASLQVFPSERRSEIASDPVLNRAAQLARIQSPQDIGPPSPMDQVRQAWSRFMAGDGEAAPAAPAHPSGAEILRPHLAFSQALDSGTVTVEALANKPETAVLIANAVAQAFRDQLSGDAGAPAPDTDLPERLQSLEADAAAAKNAVESFRASRNFGDSDKAGLERAFDAAKAETARIGAEAGRLSGMTAESLLRDGVPEDMRSGALGQLVERYRAAGGSDAGKAIAAQIDTEIANRRSLVQAELKKAVESEQKAASAMTGLNAAPATDEDRNRLQALERDAAARQALFEDLQMRAARGDLAASSGADGTIRIVTPAQISSEPHGLSLKTSLLAGLVAGLWLGLFSCLFGGRAGSSPDGPQRGEAEPDEVLETYGETRLAAAIREANERWEIENSGSNTVEEAKALRRTIEDVRADRAVRS